MQNRENYGSTGNKSNNTNQLQEKRGKQHRHRVGPGRLRRSDNPRGGRPRGIHGSLPRTQNEGGLRETQLGPRMPTFLAAPMTKTSKASLRICLNTTTVPEKIKMKAPTPEGIAELECYPYVRNKRGGLLDRQTRLYEEQLLGCRNQEKLARLATQGRKDDGIPTSAMHGLRKEGSRKREVQHGSRTPYGECYICKDKTHWARYCPDRRF